MSLEGVTRFSDGHEAEFTELNRWIREYNNFNKLKQMKTFSKFGLWKAFYTWSKQVKWKWVISLHDHLQWIWGKNTIFIKNSISFLSLRVFVLCKSFHMQATCFTWILVVFFTGHSWLGGRVSRCTSVLHTVWLTFISCLFTVHVVLCVSIWYYSILGKLVTVKRDYKIISSF